MKSFETQKDHKLILSLPSKSVRGVSIYGSIKSFHLYCLSIQIIKAPELKFQSLSIYFLKFYLLTYDSLLTEINWSVKKESCRNCHIVIFTFCIINGIEYGNSDNYTWNKIFEDTIHYTHLQSILYSIFLLKNLSK